MSTSTLRELAAHQGLELRFLDLDGMPLENDVGASEPMNTRSYVLIGWPAAQIETTTAVEKAMTEREKPEMDRLGLAGKVGWCSIACTPFDFAKYEAALQADAEYEDDDEEAVPAEIPEPMRLVKTGYHLRCGLRPKQCSHFLQKVAELIRDASDGFVDE